MQILPLRPLRKGGPKRDQTRRSSKEGRRVFFFPFTLIPMDATRCARSPILLEDSVLQTTCNGASPPDPLLAFFNIIAMKP